MRKLILQTVDGEVENGKQSLTEKCLSLGAVTYRQLLSLCRVERDMGYSDTQRGRGRVSYPTKGNIFSGLLCPARRKTSICLHIHLLLRP